MKIYVVREEITALQKDTVNLGAFSNLDTAKRLRNMRVSELLKIHSLTSEDNDSIDADGNFHGLTIFTWHEKYLDDPFDEETSMYYGRITIDEMELE